MIVYEYIARKGAKDAINKKLSDLALTMKTRDEIPDQIPDEVNRDIILEFDAFDREIYNELEKEMILNLDDAAEITAATAADLSMKLVQITSGAVYADESKEVHELNTLKLDTLRRIVEQDDENYIVVYQFRHEVERIMREFPEAKLFKSGRNAKKTFDDWNNKKIKLLLIHPASAGHGLNFQFGGRSIVWFSLTWNLEHYEQANWRVIRRGGAAEVFIYRLIVKGTKDEDVRRALVKKEGEQTFLMREIKRWQSILNSKAAK